MNKLTNAGMRVEADMLCSAFLTPELYYGVYTLRVVANFVISDTLLRDYPDQIRALVMMNLVAARMNRDLRLLATDRHAAIETATTRLLDGKGRDAFSMNMILAGEGSLANMNTNKVIANLGFNPMRRPQGDDYAVLHPLNDLNRSPSTSDIYPTALRLSLSFAAARLVVSATEDLDAALRERADAVCFVIKLCRPHSQDEVLMTEGAEVGLMPAADVTRLELAACGLELGEPA